MKKIIIYFILFISGIGFSQSELVKAEIDTTKIRIGEQFTYKISVEGTQNVIIPKLRLNGLEVVDSLKTDTIKNSLVKKYILTGFDSGAFYIPQQQIFVRNKAILTDSLLVNVATVAIDTTKIKKYEIKGIRSENYKFDDFKPYFYWIIAILLVIGFLLYFFVFKKKKEQETQVVVPVLPPYEEAINSLKLLDEKLLWQNNKVKKYYSELTEIVRAYIEREINIPALESTTNELVTILTKLQEKELVQTEKEIIIKLKELLKEADLVKFAKSKPLALEIEENRKDAENIINNLKTKPVNEEEDAE